MGPKPREVPPQDLFRYPLKDQLKLTHELIQLADLMDWEKINQSLCAHFVSTRGRPALSPRLVAGLLYLQHCFDCSDEAVINTWIENPYWQYFTGETYLQTEAPMDPSSLTRWRKRLGQEGVEVLLMGTIEAGRRGGFLKTKSTDAVLVDTTVMPKAVAYPTDARLYEQARQHLVKLADDHQLKLRQNYNREGPRLALQVSRYAHAKQYRRMRASLKLLRTRVGRVQRDVMRQVHHLPEAIRVQAQALFERTQRILTQQRHDSHKLYALHAPEVECIAKGKVRTPYEFGVKVSLATTLKEGWVVGMAAMPGNPWDGHTLEPTLKQVQRLTQHLPKTAVVDKGYRSVKVEGVKILRSGQRRGVTRQCKAMIKRRSAVEASIGHMKMEGRLARNPLKGALGDAIHAVMCGAGHNIRLLLAKLRLFCASLRISMTRFFQFFIQYFRLVEPDCLKY